MFDELLEAPATVAISQDDDVILRIKGTFLEAPRDSFRRISVEAVRIDEELPAVSMRRSWSDGDLDQLCEAT